MIRGRKPGFQEPGIFRKPIYDRNKERRWNAGNFYRHLARRR